MASAGCVWPASLFVLTAACLLHYVPLAAGDGPDAFAPPCALPGYCAGCSQVHDDSVPVHRACLCTARAAAGHLPLVPVRAVSGDARYLGLLGRCVRGSSVRAAHAPATRAARHARGRRFLIFLGIYNGVVNNGNMSRFVRYNAMQAVLLDVLLM